MKIPTCKLKDRCLDYAVGIAERLNVTYDRKGNILVLVTLFGETTEHGLRPSSEWMQGGVIIEREKMAIMLCESVGDWLADLSGTDKVFTAFGPTPLVAAMRCYVASRLGHEVEIPDELIGA